MPNKGGRGIERLRLFGVPNPAAARISRYLVLHQYVAVCKALPECTGPSHSILQWQPCTPPRTMALESQTLRCRCRCLRHSTLDSRLSTLSAPQPSLADRIWLEMLSRALGWATPPSLVADLGGVRTNRCAFKKRPRRNLGAGSVCHPCPLTHQARTGACVGVPVSKSTCT